MRKQWACSRCGFPCSSMWRNLNLSVAVICNTCKSKEAESKVVNELAVDEGAKINLLGSSSLTQISPSTSIVHQNVAFSVGQIGMIFGNLTFEPTLAIPLILRGKSLELKVKSEVVTANDNCVTQVQDHFYCGKSSKPSSTSTMGGDSTIKIKQEYEGEQTTTLVEAENEALWDTKKVKKKKRSKLPQYTLSPLARFINQLRHAPCQRRGRRPPRRLRAAVVVGPKYDDVLIYQKCLLYVPENEIGLGAELLVPHSPPAVVVYGSRKSSRFVIKEESSSSTNESGSSNCSCGLIDVPVNCVV